MTHISGSRTSVEQSLGESSLPMGGELSISLLIPAYNEEIGIGNVISSFRQALPTAEIYVYDNNSTDSTAEVAIQLGAIVRQEPRQGKGYVVRRMFADIDADIYILVDGDNTYDARLAPTLVELLLHQGLDMINCARVPTSATAHRPGHQLGNHSLSGIVRMIFGDNFKDMLSGYRVFSRRFVKSFPAMTRGFEIETELRLLFYIGADVVRSLLYSLFIPTIPNPIAKKESTTTTFTSMTELI